LGELLPTPPIRHTPTNKFGISFADTFRRSPENIPAQGSFSFCWPPKRSPPATFWFCQSGSRVECGPAVRI
jgi:hypothetical protein